MTCDLRPLDVTRFESILDRIEPRCDSMRRAFVEDFAQAEANLVNDPLLAVASKFGVLDAIVACPVVDPGKCLDAALKYCDEHQRLGPRVPEPQDLLFGHAMTRNKLKGIFASTVDSTLPHTLAGAVMDHMMDEFLSAELDEQRSDLETTALSRYQMWSFIGPNDKRNPFDGVVKQGEELRRRLGLGFYAPVTEFVHCTVDLATGPPVHVPTTLDSRLNRYFRPGGKTYPLDGASDGLDEVVHEPAIGAQLASPLRPAA